MDQPNRILVVDDSPVNRRLLRDMLEVSDYQVEEAEDGEAALEVFSKQEFHLVISDVRMPRMNGIELLERIRVQKPRVPVIIVTAFADVETAVEALRLGATNFVQKPFSVKDLSEIVEKCLRSWRVNRGQGDGILHYRKTLEYRLASTTTVIDPIFQALLEAAHSVGYPEAEVRLNVYLALSEALANAIHHGNQGSPDKEVLARIEIDRERIFIRIEDQGSGFDPSAVPDPTEPENLMRTSGRGVFLMRCYMDRVDYLEGGRIVELEKAAKPAPEASAPARAEGPT